ncbi:lymphocyte cytosolic protein 2 [Tiliqua scincoides]|uniref:lymphocyte cytosolic protein 2 n=1 Tax=Tiliqua scincoides TaxID=71010 RepID=UPI0034631045
MDSRNIPYPYRSEVARWTPDELSDYFRRLNFKDCEKVVRKNNITGQRFLNMSENDIQKFPKLRVPLLSKLSQEINRNEQRKTLFPKRTHMPKVQETIDLRPDDCDVWSSFDDSDDYESPDDQGHGDGVDYESPNEDGMDDENDGDYEPPPSNDEGTHRIFPSTPLPPPSEYIDRPPSLQPPIPPQRPGSSPVPEAAGARSTRLPVISSSSNNESNKEKNMKFFRPQAPTVDRSKKPQLDLPGGARRAFPEMPSALPSRLGEELARIPKPPVPPTDRYDSNSVSRRKPPPKNNSQGFEKGTEMEDTNVPQRPVPQPPLHPPLCNTFPTRSPKLQFKQSPSLPKDTYPESTVFPGGSLPTRLQSIICNTSKGPADGRPPLPIPNKPTTQPPRVENEEMLPGSKFNPNQGTTNQKWYAADITRPEAEVALRDINQDGTFLVRDSSKKTVEQPYVLMVLYNDKVYNIQIRYKPEDQVYVLGTGLKGNEDFYSVTEIIDYFRRMPLRLIDGKDRCSRKQCLLKYAAGSQ